VDWGKLAQPPCYIQAATNVELSGSCTAQLIDNLLRVRNLPLRSFHVIGFSLGAQVSGQVAKHLKSGKLRRITGIYIIIYYFGVNSRLHEILEA
jgi:pimeloyl-ACP methyl ester carboxylesterase